MNESDKNAHVVCGDVEGAKKYCPTRWRALQSWFDEAHMVSRNKTHYYIRLTCYCVSNPASRYF